MCLRVGSDAAWATDRGRRSRFGWLIAHTPPGPSHVVREHQRWRSSSGMLPWPKKWRSHRTAKFREETSIRPAMPAGRRRFGGLQHARPRRAHTAGGATSVPGMLRGPAGPLPCRPPGPVSGRSPFASPRSCVQGRPRLPSPPQPCRGNTRPLSSGKRRPRAMKFNPLSKPERRIFESAS